MRHIIYVIIQYDFNRLLFLLPFKNNKYKSIPCVFYCQISFPEFNDKKTYISHANMHDFLLIKMRTIANMTTTNFRLHKLPYSIRNRGKSKVSPFFFLQIKIFLWLDGFVCILLSLYFSLII
jgi:hypothetical protein